MAEEKNEVAPGVTVAQADETFTEPALFVNRIILNLTPIGGRLTFLEDQPGGAPSHARAAVFLGIADLVELRNLIDRMLERGELVQVPAATAETK